MGRVSHTVSAGEAVDEQDIQPVVQTLRRVADRLVDLRASARALPDTPGWQGPTRWVVDRRVDAVYQAIDTCHRLAVAARETAEDDLERARQRAEQHSEIGLWR